MFCDGKKCKKGKKQCGLLGTVTMQKGGESIIIEECVFKSIRNSLFRQEQGNIRIQAAVESQRNEEVKSSQNINDTIAKGLVAVVKSVRGRSLEIENPKEEVIDA